MEGYNVIKFYKTNLKYLRELRGWSQQYVADKIGVDRSLISYWETDKAEISIDHAFSLAKLFGVPFPEFVGTDLRYNNAELIEFPTKTIKIPILGKIPAGIPIEAIEDVIGYEEIPVEWTTGNKKWFALKIHGDSMSPKYETDDIIIVLQQHNCESGQDCVVMVNGDDATFKRVIKQEGNFILKPLNNDYEPILLTAHDIATKPVKILGIAKEIRRKLS